MMITVIKVREGEIKKKKREHSSQLQAIMCVGAYPSISLIILYIRIKFFCCLL